MKKIITFNHPLLTRVAKEAKPANPELKKIIREMVAAMEKENGIGLAAPQIGRSLKIITVKTNEGALVLLNPKILRKSFRKIDMEEGCLSFPGYFGIVSRPRKIRVCYYNINGQKISLAADGLLARVLQHEIDHLNGKLFIYQVKKFTKGDPDELNKKMRS